MSSRLITCPDCGDPNVSCNVLLHRCDVCAAAHYWQRQQDNKRRQLMNDPTIPPLVERNLMNSLHLHHAHNIHDATELRACGTCGQTSGNDDLCVYCRNGRQNPNTRAWTQAPRQQAPAAASAGEPQHDFDFEAFRGLSSDFPKKARLFDITGTTDRELACIICMEDIPPEAPRVYYCDCQALICESCESKPGVLHLTKCPICRKDYKFF